MTLEVKYNSSPIGVQNQCRAPTRQAGERRNPGIRAALSPGRRRGDDERHGSRYAVAPYYVTYGAHR